MSDVKKCAHELCSCTVSGKDKYCSQSCEDNKGITQLTCDCKHPECSSKL